MSRGVEGIGKAGLSVCVCFLCFVFGIGISGGVAITLQQQ